MTRRERGGPPLAGPQGQDGFGSSLAHKAVAGQLGGSLSCDWAAAGLRVTITIPPSGPAAPAA